MTQLTDDAVEAASGGFGYIQTVTKCRVCGTAIDSQMLVTAGASRIDIKMGLCGNCK